MSDFWKEVFNRLSSVGVHRLVIDAAVITVVVLVVILFGPVENRRETLASLTGNLPTSEQIVAELLNDSNAAQELVMSALPQGTILAWYSTGGRYP